MLGFIIWTLAAVVFAGVGICAWTAQKPIGFFTSVKPDNIQDPVSYNHAVARLWFAAAAVFELLGLPLLSGNTLVILLAVGVLFLLMIAMIAIYLKIEGKYKGAR